MIGEGGSGLINQRVFFLEMRIYISSSKYSLLFYQRLRRTWKIVHFSHARDHDQQAICSYARRR